MGFSDKISESLESNGHNPDIIKQFLWFIDAFDPPIELLRVTKNLLGVIPHLEKLIQKYPENNLDLQPNAWANICRELIGSNFVANTSKKGKKPLWGRYETNPVYVALWHRPDTQPYQGIYSHLLAHCLFAISALRKRVDAQGKERDSDETIDVYRGNIRTALLLIRNLALHENRTKLEELPDLNLPLEEILKNLDQNDADLAPLRVLFKYFLDIRKPPHRSTDSIHLAQTHQRCAHQINLPADLILSSVNCDPQQSDSHVGFQWLQLPTISEDTAVERDSFGCSPSEARSGIEIIFPRIYKNHPRQSRSPQQKVQGKRKKKAQLAMLNQRFAFRWEVLSLYDVSTFLTAIADLFLKKGESKYLPQGAQSEEFVILMTILFWFGQRVSSVKLIKMYQHDQIHAEAGPGVVVTQNDGVFWLTRPASPARKILPNKTQREQAWSTTPCFALHTGVGIEEMLGAYCKKNQLNGSNLLFPNSQNYYEGLLQEFLRLINHRHATRLTGNKVSDFMMTSIESHAGADITTAMFIVGRDQFLGRNPSYYTALPVRRLQSIFHDVCRSVRDRHFFENPRKKQRRLDRFPHHWNLISDVHVGSPFRPTSQTVSNLALFLKGGVKAADRSKTSVLKLMRFHNSITRYVVFMVAFSTGFRAIRDPFLSSAEIDWHSGFAVLSDKDNEDGYNARLIWIPSICLQQLRLFLEHHNNILSRLSILVPSIPSWSDRWGRINHHRSMFFVKYSLGSGEYCAVSSSPSHFGTRLRDKFSLPFNASRHYLRSSLLERGCPVEVINAFMGHYERGEEPWGKYSGLSPRVYRDVLAEYLVPLLAEDGWEALPGLGARL